MTIGLFVVTTVSAQQASVPLSELQRREKLENAIRVLDEADAALTKVVAAREMACKKAIGSDRFCSCLTEALPVAWTFEQYVAITTKSKVENQYAALDKEYRAAYDAVGPIRDRCVAVFQQPPAVSRK